MLLWMMFPLAIWGGTDKTGSFDLWKAMAMPGLPADGVADEDDLEDAGDGIIIDGRPLAENGCIRGNP